MTGVHGFVRANCRILVFPGLLLLGEDIDILAKGPLIALQRENVIGILLDDFSGKLAWLAKAETVNPEISCAIDIARTSRCLARGWRVVIRPAKP